MKYFAYGSNLCIGRLTERVPSAIKIGKAKLVGYELRFHKKSNKDGSAKADAFRTGDQKDVVWGVIYEIEDSEKTKLDNAEGLSKGYDEGVVTVVNSMGVEEDVHAYFANPKSIDNSLRPYSWYVRFVLEGARQHELPEEYIQEFIVPVKTDKDPDKRRDAENNIIKCGWQVRKLGEIAEISSGQGAPQGEQHFTEEGYPFIRAGSLDALVNGKGLTGLERISENTASRFRLKLFPIGAVLFAKSGMSATKDRVVVLNEPAYVVNHLAVVIPTDDLDSYFLRFWLSLFGPSKLIKDEGYPSIRLEDIAQISIPLPPPPIQKQIAAILEKADAAREKRRQANQLTEQFLQSAFLEMFGDPVTNPKGFSIREMESVCNKVTDGEHLTPKLKPSGKYIIMAKDVRGDRIDFSQNHFVSEEEFIKFTRRCNPEMGDILLVSRGATIGRCTGVRISTPFCLMGSVILIKPRDVTSQYIEYLFKNSKFGKYVINLSPASAQQAIYLQNLKKLRVPVPPKELQNKFAALVEKVEKLREKQKESQRELESLFNSLMQRAFKGELVS